MFNGYNDINKSVRETEGLVNLFLETNLSDLELAKRIGLSAATVGRRLTNKHFIMQAFPENGEEIYKKVQRQRKDNLIWGRKLGAAVSQIHNYQGTNYPKLNIEFFYKEREKQVQALFHMALTFRVKIGILANLFNLDEDELFNDLTNYVKEKTGLAKAFYYLCNNDYTDEEEAIHNLLAFYREYLEAIRLNDRVAAKNVISKITDIKAKEFKNKPRKPTDRISEEEVADLLNYQLKYALSGNALAMTFNINRANINYRILEYIKDKPELKKRYEDLCDYNSYIAKINVNQANNADEYFIERYRNGHRHR